MWQGLKTFFLVALVPNACASCTSFEGVYEDCVGPVDSCGTIPNCQNVIFGSEGDLKTTVFCQKASFLVVDNECLDSRFTGNSYGVCTGNGSCTGVTVMGNAQLSCNAPDSCKDVQIVRFPGDTACCTGHANSGCPQESLCPSPTAEPSADPTARPTMDPTAEIAENETPFICAKQKVKCPKGEYFELVRAFFGRTDLTDATCTATYKDAPDHICAANAQTLATNIKASCNGKQKCKLNPGKKLQKTFGLREGCNPYLQVEYNCVGNTGFYKSKKQVKKARKLAMRTGDWDFFFETLDPSA